MPTADLIVTGGSVRTLDPERPHASAVAVREGTIVAVGEQDVVRDWRGPATEVVDLAGAWLVPGLVDSHSHPVWGLHLTTGLDLAQVGDLDGLRAALVSAERIDGWVVGYGLDHNVFGAYLSTVPWSRTSWGSPGFPAPVRRPLRPRHRYGPEGGGRHRAPQLRPAGPPRDRRRRSAHRASGRTRGDGSGRRRSAAPVVPPTAVPAGRVALRDGRHRPHRGPRHGRR